MLLFGLRLLLGLGLQFPSLLQDGSQLLIGSRLHLLDGLNQLRHSRVGQLVTEVLLLLPLLVGSVGQPDGHAWLLL